MFEGSSAAAGEGASSLTKVWPSVFLPVTAYAAVKPVVDAALALVLLVLTAPLLALAALLVKLTSRGPVIYSQKRLGLDGRVFTIYKIRSMTYDCERESGPRWALPRDPRVTPVGRFLRRTHLDELPQLWNVLRGEMSLVGPRPERPEIATQLVRVLPDYSERLKVRPGVTGLAQVQLPADTDLESVRLKLQYDLYYAQRASLGLDLRILLATLPHLFGLPHSVSEALFGLPGRKAITSCFERVSIPDAGEPEVRPRESAPRPELDVHCTVDDVVMPHPIAEIGVGAALTQ